MARPRLFSFCALVIPQDKEAHDGPPLHGTRGLGLVKFLRWLAFHISLHSIGLISLLSASRHTLEVSYFFLSACVVLVGCVSVEKRLYYSKTMAKVEAGVESILRRYSPCIKPLNVRVDQEQKAEPRQNELSSARV